MKSFKFRFRRKYAKESETLILKELVENHFLVGGDKQEREVIERWMKRYTEDYYVEELND